MTTDAKINLIVLAGCLCVAPAGAQDGVVAQVEVLRKDAASAVPELAAIDTPILVEAARGALTIAAEHLLNLCQTNYLSLALPPVTQRPIVGYEEQIPYEIRYREEKDHYREDTVQVPVYKDIYEEYDTFDVGSGSSTEARKIGKVKAKRLVKREQIGTKPEKRQVPDPNGPIIVPRLVPDPNGPIVKQYTRPSKPIYGVGNDIHQGGNIGANALVYVALRKCGVPEDHPILDNMLREFERLANDYAIPDDTWSVAWLTAAFCNSRQERYKDLREWLVSKLIDGQIKEGPGRGFWGPVCINAELLPALLEYEQELGKRRDEAKAKLKEKPDDEKRRKEAESAESELEAFVLHYRWVTQQGLRFAPKEDCTARCTVAKREGIPGISVAGLAYPYHNQAVADMDSTFTAMFAIREAADNGYLVANTRRWMTTKTKPVAYPEESDAVLARMASALTTRMKPGGQWDECNTHQPIAAFQALGLASLLPEDVLSLQSPLTHLSVAQGYASLLNAGRAVGLNKLLGKFGPQAMAAMAAQQDAARAYLAGQAAGRLVEPYDFFLTLTGVHRNLGGEEETRRDLWVRLAYKLVMVQNPDGTWGKAGEMLPIYSSGFKEFMIRRAETAYNLQQAKAEAANRKPFDAQAWWNQYSWNQQLTLSRPILSTAMAMIFLADGVRMPAAAFATTGDTKGPMPNIMAKAFKAIRNRDKLVPTYLRVTTNTVATDLLGVPVVFVSQDTDLSNIRVYQALKGYTDSGGTILAEVPTTAALAAFQPKLLGLVTQGRLAPVPEDAPILTNFQGTKPKLNCVVGTGGRMAVIIIPLDVVSPATAVQTAYLFIKGNAASGYFDPDYAWKCSEKEGALMRIRSVAQLRAEAAAAAVATTVPVQAVTGTTRPATNAATPLPPPKTDGPRVRKADEKW